MDAKVARSRGNGRGSASSQEDLLESVRAINHEFLIVMSEFARRSYQYQTLLGELAPLFLKINPALAHQASRFPFLLFDLQLSNAPWWDEDLLGTRFAVKDAVSASRHVPKKVTSVMRSGLTLAWHTVRTDLDSALVLIGLSTRAAAALASMTLHDTEILAVANSSAMRPRWISRVSLWRELLRARNENQVDATRDFVTHALQLTAGALLR